MFGAAISVGIFAYAIFFLGIVGKLDWFWLLIVSFLFIGYSFYRFRHLFRLVTLMQVVIYFNHSLLQRLLLIILLLQALINLVGVLGPELSFDALWYHLTLPKLYLVNSAVQYIPGGLLYYSAMPQLGEMLYIPSLLLGGDIGAKFVHFLFGIGCCVLLYQFSRRYLSVSFAVLAVVIFYTNPVVSWESTIAYIDLIWAFFSLGSFFSLFLGVEQKDKKYMSISAALFGFAIGSKLLSLGYIIPVSLVIIISLWGKYTFYSIARMVIIYCGIAMLVSLPWFAYAYSATGNPVHPLFSSLYPVGVSQNLLNPIIFIRETFRIFTTSADPISPIYLIMLPLVFYVKKFSKQELVLSVFALMLFIIWYITPRTGGGRFMLPVLPVLSVMVVVVLTKLKKVDHFIYKFCVVLVIVTVITCVAYRGIASAKYIPVVIGAESKEEFLTKHLNFHYGDFYDIDGYFKKNISENDKVLLYGFHNLYYVDFPFIHASWVKKGDRFNYIAVQYNVLPKKYGGAKLIYENPKTRVKLFKLPKFTRYE